MKQNAISHDHREETVEAKALWFQSLPVEERMRLLVSYTDLILQVNPHIPEKRDVESVTGRVQILAEE